MAIHTSDQENKTYFITGGLDKRIRLWDVRRAENSCLIAGAATDNLDHVNIAYTYVPYIQFHLLNLLTPLFIKYFLVYKYSNILLKFTPKISSILNSFIYAITKPALTTPSAARFRGCPWA